MSDNNKIPQKHSNPNWKTIFILLFIVNIIFYVASNSWQREIIREMAGSSTGGAASFVYFSLAFAFDILNTLVVFKYIRKRHPQGMAKVISYIALIYLVLRTLSYLPFFLWRLIGGLIPRF